MENPDNPQVKAIAQVFDKARRTFNRQLAAMGAQLDQWEACLCDGDMDALNEMCKPTNRTSDDEPPRDPV
jgi:hypothetical protein